MKSGTLLAAFHPLGLTLFREEALGEIEPFCKVGDLAIQPADCVTKFGKLGGIRAGLLRCFHAAPDEHEQGRHATNGPEDD